jgi:hypothetical protein
MHALSRDRFVRELRSVVRLSWSVFWKVTLGLSCIAVVLWASFNNRNAPLLSLDSLLGCLVIFGYALVAAAWIGLALAVFAVSWRYFGGWILIPIVLTLAAAILAVSGGIALLAQRAPIRAGLHGGGEVALALILAGLGVLAALGGTLGAIAGTVLSIGLASASRNRRHLRSTDAEQAAPIDLQSTSLPETSKPRTPGST